MPTYRIRIDRGDTHFEAEGDKQFVLDMLARLERPPALNTPAKPSKDASTKAGKGKRAETSGTDVSKGMSAGEFIRQCEFRKHTDVVVAFGYYLEKHSGVTEFAAADINN